VVRSSIQLIDLTSGKQVSLQSIDPAKGRLEAPSWSPDGQNLAYVEFRGAGRLIDSAHLVIQGKDGRAVFTGRSADAFPFPAVWLSNNDLLYTAEGKILRTSLDAGTETSIAFQADIPCIRPTFRHRVYDFDGTAPRTVKGIYAPALSPDGKEVAFVALNQIYIMPIGGRPVPLTHDLFYNRGLRGAPTEGRSPTFQTATGLRIFTCIP